MDLAWAMYEAWLKIQTGEVDSALVYGFGKSSPGDLHEIMTLQYDPYYYAPLWPASPTCRPSTAVAATKKSSPRSRPERNATVGRTRTRCVPGT